MQSILGSHWRGRLLLLLAFVVLLVGARSQTPWWNMGIVHGDGSRVVVSMLVGEQLTVKVLDEETGQFHKVVQFEGQNARLPLRVVRDGKALTWWQGNTLFTADLDAPHTIKSWPIPSEIKVLSVEGLSSDERFALVQSPFVVNVPDAGGTSKTVHRFLLRVVDLTNGKIVSSQPSATPIETIRTNEFRFAPTVEGEDDGTEEPVVTSWHLTSQGQWEPLESIPSPSVRRHHRIRLAQSLQGSFRILSENEKVTTPDVEVAGYLVATSPTGHLLVDPLVGVRDRTWVGRLDGGELRRLDAAVGYSDITFPKDDVASTVNVWDDLELLDLNTGKTIKTFAFGTFRKQVLGAFAIGALVIAVAWAWIGAREKSSWWLVDAAMATACVPAAPLILLAANHWTWALTNSPGPMFGLLAFIAGTLAGVSVMTGWYWAYGRGRAPVRWIIGGAWSCLLCTYLSKEVVNGQLGIRDGHLGDMDVLWAFCLAGSLIAAGMVAILLLMIKASGWSVVDTPQDEPSHRFTLTSMLVGIVGVSALVALGTAAPVETYWYVLSCMLVPLTLTISAGVLIVSLILSRSAWLALLQAFALVLILPVLWMLARGFLGMVLPPPLPTWISTAFLTGSVVPIVIASGLARCHGWRWTRTPQASPGVSASVEPARELTVAAPARVVV